MLQQVRVSLHLASLSRWGSALCLANLLRGVTPQVLVHFSLSSIELFQSRKLVALIPTRAIFVVLAVVVLVIVRCRVKRFVATLLEYCHGLRNHSTSISGVCRQEDGVASLREFLECINIFRCNPKLSSGASLWRAECLPNLS